MRTLWHLTVLLHHIKETFICQRFSSSEKVACCLGLPLKKQLSHAWEILFVESTCLFQHLRHLEEHKSKKVQLWIGSEQKSEERMLYSMKGQHWVIVQKLKYLRYMTCVASSEHAVGTMSAITEYVIAAGESFWGIYHVKHFKVQNVFWTRGWSATRRFLLDRQCLDYV